RRQAPRRARQRQFLAVRLIRGGASGRPCGTGVDLHCRTRRAARLGRSFPQSSGGNMNIDLAGKRAIVAGGSRGIGRAIALAFAEAGAGVSICARGAERLAATRDEIARHGGTTHSAVCDLANATAVPRYVEDAAAALGGIDILVNNASGFGTTDDEAGWEVS